MCWIRSCEVRMLTSWLDLAGALLLVVALAVLLWPMSIAGAIAAAGLALLALSWSVDRIEKGGES